jgi:cytochrome c peroxidase
MALPSDAEVVARVAGSDYAYLFNLAFNTVDFNNLDLTFDQIAIAIAFFEESGVLNKFSSAYDNSLLIGDQDAGFKLFMDETRAMCVLCHVANAPGDKALFTDFSYDNLGIPQNPLIADKGVDPGLGGFIAKVIANSGDYPTSLTDEIMAGGWEDAIGDNWGKHKVSTLRNIDLTPPYGHNGFFPNLTSIVQFYNTRDPLACSEVVGIPVTPALLADGKIPGYNGNNEYCWPAPEIIDNVNDAELGNLGLTNSEVDQIVAFLEALTD